MKKENLGERNVWAGNSVPLIKERSMPMGKVDTATKAYMRKNNIFADAFNYLIYDGKPVVNPEQLRELDTTEITSGGRSVSELGQMLEGTDCIEKQRMFRNSLNFVVPQNMRSQ